MLRRLWNSPYLFFGLAALGVLVAIFAQLEIDFPKRPAGTPEEISLLAERDDLNLVFIVIDTLRSDRLGSYGYDRDTSPAMDAIARAGIRFDKVESQSSWTKASMASLWTGMYPRTTGVDHFAHALPQEALMPAEILKEAGFQTGGIFRNGWLMPNFGFSQGFDLYVRPRARYREGQLQQESPLMRQLQGNDLDVTESAIEFIRSNKSERFFLYLHLMDVHQYLYDDKSALFGSGYSDIYDNSIHWVDRNISEVVHELESLGIADKTIVVLAADHGEAFSEHGVEGHARNLFGEVQNVPLIMSLPFILEPGIEVKTRVANVDIWPTLLDLMGLPSLPGAEGQSLLPLIAAAAKGDESTAGELANRPVYSQLNKAWGQPPREEKIHLVSVVQEPYRFIWLEPVGKAALFDHGSDPTEQNSLAQTEDEIVADRIAEFKDTVATFIGQAEPAWGDAPEVEISELRLGQLRALGYAVPEMKNPKRESQLKREERARKEALNAEAAEAP